MTLLVVRQIFVSTSVLHCNRYCVHISGFLRYHVALICVGDIPLLPHKHQTYLDPALFRNRTLTAPPCWMCQSEVPPNSSHKLSLRTLWFIPTVNSASKQLCISQLNISPIKILNGCWPNISYVIHSFPKLKTWERRGNQKNVVRKSVSGHCH